MISVALLPLKIFFVKMNFVLLRIKINQNSWFCVFKSSYSHSYTLCYICINGTFLTSFLVTSRLLPFIWKLIDHKFLNNIFFYQEARFRCKSFPSFVFILLVPFASFGCTEQRHYNLNCSIIRLTLESFETSLKQITISLSQ